MGGTVSVDAPTGSDAKTWEDDVLRLAAVPVSSVFSGQVRGNARALSEEGTNGCSERHRTPTQLNHARWVNLKQYICWNSRPNALSALTVARRARGSHSPLAHCSDDVCVRMLRSLSRRR